MVVRKAGWTAAVVLAFFKGADAIHSESVEGRVEAALVMVRHSVVLAQGTCILDGFSARVPRIRYLLDWGMWRALGQKVW